MQQKNVIMEFFFCSCFSIMSSDHSWYDFCKINLNCNIVLDLIIVSIFEVLQVGRLDQCPKN